MPRLALHNTLVDCGRRGVAAAPADGLEGVRAAVHLCLVTAQVLAHFSKEHLQFPLLPCSHHPFYPCLRFLPGKIFIFRNKPSTFLSTTCRRWTGTRAEIPWPALTPTRLCLEPPAFLLYLAVLHLFMSCFLAGCLLSHCLLFRPCLSQVKSYS
jgi:hypothetical protein